MEKTCIINPVTGRAVKIDSRLGKKLNKDKNNREDSAVKKLQAVVRRSNAKKPQETKTIEIETKKERKPRGGGGRKKKEPVSVVKSAGSDDMGDAIKKIQAAVRRKTTKKPDLSAEVKKAVNKDIAPKVKTEVKKVIKNEFRKVNLEIDKSKIPKKPAPQYLSEEERKALKEEFRRAEEAYNKRWEEVTQGGKLAM